MKRAIVVILSLGLLVMVLSGFCAVSADTKVTITFWHGMGSALGKTLDELVAQFQKQNPGIVVKAEYQGSYSALSQKIMASLAAKKPPTVAQAYGNWVAEYVKSGAVKPVEDFFAGSGGLSKDEIEDFWPELRVGCTFNGKMYTLPFNKSVAIYIYNLSALKESGLKAPSTWEELLAACKATTVVKDGKTVRYGMVLRPNVDYFANLLFTNGGRYLDESGRKAVFNSPEGVEALQFMVDMLHKHKVAYYIPGYADADFGAGKTCGYFATSASYSYTDSAVGAKFEWGIGPIPYKKRPAAPVAGTDLVMFAAATPEEQQAAWKFMKWLTSPTQTAYWAVKTGYIPVRRSALYLRQMQEWMAANPRNAASLNALKFAVTDPNIAEWQEIREVISQAVEEAFLLKASPKQALDKAAQKVDAILAR
ncbi:MAG: ABC transporter substrate-binding protein [Firmicutes bacterium]|nr:ABC transporter substrate-binding protein [Bacillota bacterium]MDH7494995.1 ABC transporter substrate-binding protein [Bacillota bacterium]